jgi:hypothetical protein
MEFVAALPDNAYRRLCELIVTRDPYVVGREESS